MQSGDIILEFDGQAINSSSDLPHVVGLIAPGSEVKAVVRREGSNQTLQVVVGGLDAGDRPSVSGRMPDANSNEAVFGMVLETADDEMMAELGLSGGVLVLEVAPESPAAMAGIVGGDVVTRLGSSAVQSTNDFETAVARLRPGQSVAIRLIRRGAPLFLAIRVPQAEQ